MAALTLTAGPLSLRLRADWGGRVTALSHAAQGDWLVPIDEAAGFQPWSWPKGGAYPLIPFHGRIPGARITWQGAVHDITAHPDMAGAALHGPAHRLAWTVAHRTGHSARLTLDHACSADWPFACRATQDVTLGPDRLDVAMRIENTGAVTMPYDLGWHPYFPKAARFGTDAKRHWPQGAIPGVPTGDCVAGALPDLAGCTTFLGDWSRFDLLAPMRLRLTASENARHLVVHDDPPGYVCAEPACAPANAVNLGLAPQLDPGARAEAWFRLRDPSQPAG